LRDDPDCTTMLTLKLYHNRQIGRAAAIAGTPNLSRATPRRSQRLANKDAHDRAPPQPPLA
jgi:hypothetical protein